MLLHWYLNFLCSVWSIRHVYMDCHLHYLFALGASFKYITWYNCSCYSSNPLHKYWIMFQTYAWHWVLPCALIDSLCDVYCSQITMYLVNGMEISEFEFTIIIATICKLQLVMHILLFLQSYLRVSQQLHTVSQVVVGATIGSIFSIVVYWLWNAFMRDAFVSSMWFRIIMVSGSIGLCLGFILFAIRHWLQDD